MADTKKTVLFIVEGPSDKSALEKIFRTIYRRNKNIQRRMDSCNRKRYLFAGLTIRYGSKAFWVIICYTERTRHTT